ncbi:hypothetical protein BG006_010436 [Podila minutissima]|uniref:RRM domain-containing protein n=1 Tax=Podila minutissima TaxID=64525 RepID=A0A9P5VIR7_9FUNG|nr:hypothetical protein BG006_010436 [Podila minutissima]
MSQDTAPQAHVEEDGHKVFVGNLSFQTTEAELAELFSKPTPVLKANIITRGARSLGYGFVAYETLAHAEAAAAAYNKTELGGREINVEVAKPKVERPAAAPKERAPRKEKAPKEAAPAASNEDETGEVKPRTGRSARTRANRKSGSRNKTHNEGEESTADESPKDESRESRPKRTRARKSGRKDGNGETPAAASTPAVPRTVGPPSKTTVFVANLPFAMEDEGLKALFVEFKVASAHVVRRRGSGRSKGFGFVELVDEAEQQNVIEKMKNAQADGRELVIKVALSEEQGEKESA